MESLKDTYSQKFHPANITHYRQHSNKFFFYTADTILELHVISEQIFRLRYAADGLFQKDFSYAIKADAAKKPFYFKLKDGAHHYDVVTDSLLCRIEKSNLNVTFYNAEMQIVCQDENGFHWQHYHQKGGKINYCSKRIQHDERFFGLGDKPTELDLRGKRLENYGEDTYGFKKDKDPLYKNIPFYMGLHHGISYGIFFDNSYRTIFDFGHENPHVTTFISRGGEMNYYFIYGPEMVDVSRQYTRLTGTADLPPMWALGYHQCKWSYFPDKEVKQIAAEFRNRQIPCDVIYLDIDYMDGYRCFTWNKTHFPNPTKMISELEKEGFKVVAIIDPGIKIDPDYWVYKEALAEGYFCTRADGDPATGRVWPGLCHFPDFTNAAVRSWWSNLFEDLMATGIKGIWNDMNEPAVFDIGTLPEDVRHDYDGHPCSHRKAHNIYGMQMARATFHGVKKHLFGKRPFVITRSGYSGLQRYSSVWTGDNIASWEHLWIANVQIQRLSISGVSFAGSDIGGFIDNPDGELYIRWLQMAVFHPFCRTHYAGLEKDANPQEPWTFGNKVEFLARKFITLRYQLLPYLYTTFWQQTNFGTPMIKPIVMFDQTDPETQYRMEEFMVGEKLLVCPVSTPDTDTRKMYLPRGRWFNFWDDTVINGGHELTVHAPLNKIPLFVLEGSVIPNYPKMQYVGERNVDELTLHIYFAKQQHNSYMFEDEGEGYGYKRRDYNIVKFIVNGSKNQFNIFQTITGHFEPTYKWYKIIIHGLPFEVNAYYIDGKTHKLSQKNFALGTIKFRVPRQFEEIVL
jgi:alpha-glucosidase